MTLPKGNTRQSITRKTDDSLRGMIRFMRTTVDIDADLLEHIKGRAKYEHLPCGRIISNLLRQQIEQPPRIVMTNGIPVLRSRNPGATLPASQVQEFMDTLLNEESGL